MSILYSSYHHYLDFSSGAAQSTRETLLALARSGRSVFALCGSFFDAPGFGEREFYAQASALGLRVETQTREAKLRDGTTTRYRVAKFNDSGIDCETLFIADASRVVSGSRALSPAQEQIYARHFQDALHTRRPRVYATYGGYRCAPALAEYAGRFGAKRALFLHNASYSWKELFQQFDAIVVPSEFLREYYRSRFGFSATVLPPLVDESRVVAPSRSPRFATIVNPTVEKGRAIFIALARELAETRPEVEFLVVEGRARAFDLASIPEARSLPNLHRMTNGLDPRAFYGQTKILLVPSLCEESFGRVALEALLNGIPPLGSERGALPEVVGERELILQIPERFRPNSSFLPSRAEILPWTRRLLELWDDDRRAAAIVERAATSAKERFSQRVATARALAFFDALTRE